MKRATQTNSKWKIAESVNKSRVDMKGSEGVLQLEKLKLRGNKVPEVITSRISKEIECQEG